jgi:acetyl-CoA carboxylase biotin carboxyl carrier protein
MLKVQEIRELIRLIDNSSIDEFTFEQDGSKIKMKKNPIGKADVSTVQTVIQPIEEEVKPIQVAAQPVEKALEKEIVSEPVKNNVMETENLHKITSPMVGTFYASPTPDADIYVKVGSKVTKDSIVCIVEAMKLFNEIEAEVDGEIVEILVKNGQLVEFGQPLFLVKPE